MYLTEYQKFYSRLQQQIFLKFEIADFYNYHVYTCNTTQIADTSAQLECSRFPLVETGSTTSLRTFWLVFLNGPFLK